jgi:hypothetical protein
MNTANFLGMDVRKNSITSAEPTRQIAWKDKLRLCAKYKRLMAKGKPKQVVVKAIARELSAFFFLTTINILGLTFKASLPCDDYRVKHGMAVYPMESASAMK